MMISDFTFAAYGKMLNLITGSGYGFADYHNYEAIPRPCILRHDIDYDIGMAFKLAKLEAKYCVKSTYFVLLRTEFYNFISVKSRGMLECILDLGHRVGLHFDETQYPCELSMLEAVECIQEEAFLLGRTLGVPITAVSMHRPSERILEADLKVPGIVNSYGQAFFRKFKYLSDSRHHWKEDVEAVISSGRHDRIHLLTHPFWYRDEVMDCREKLMRYIRSASIDRYELLNDNIRDLEELVKREEIELAVTDRGNS